MRILVNGKDGQLGKSFLKLVKQNRHNHFALLDFVFIGKKHLDFSNSESIVEYFEKNKFDIVINCAAYTKVDQAEDDEIQANQINNIAVKQIAKMAKKYNMRLIHFSTDFVFDGEKNKPYQEDDKTSPLGVYGKTKLAGEISLMSIMKSNAIIIRTSGVYSEYGKNFVKTIIKLSEKNENLNVISDQIGSPTYAGDLASAIIEIITSDKFISTNKPSEIYHYSNDGEISWYDFAREVVTICNIDCIVNPIDSIDYPLPAKRPKYSLLNKKKITTEFGISIMDWRKSLNICLKNLKT